MKLTDFRVRTFRNVLDSGRIAVQPDITCMVGNNDSGKTALLQALLRTKPWSPTPLEPTEHYPRWLLTRDRRSERLEEAAPIEARFEIDETDRKALEERFGPGVVRSPSFVFGLRYTGPYGSVDIDAAQAVRNVLDRADVGADTREDLAGAETIQQLRDAALTRSPTADLAAVAREVAAMLEGASTLGEAVMGLLDERMPTFVYFNDVALLPGRIDLERLAVATASDPEYLRAARALLRRAGADVEALLDGDYEDRRAELESVSNAVTAEVFSYWTQDQDLEVEIDVDQRSVPRGAARNVIEQHLEFRVRDPQRGFTTNFGQRSSGFQWFFSFLAAASAFDRFPGGAVVLLDEPGLTLHPAGQADLLRFIEQRIAPTAQVIYTTHSPFMVNPGRLERLRMVEDHGLPEGAVVVADPVEAGPSTLAPLHTALSLELGRAAFEGGTHLVVRDAADLTYLTVMSDRLGRRGRSHLDPAWRILPSGDATAVPVMVSLLGRAAAVTVLADRDSQRLLETGGPLQHRRIVSLEDMTGVPGASVEDLFTDTEYLRLYNGAHAAGLRPEQIAGSGPVLERISSVTGEDVDRQAPAARFAQRSSLQRRLSKDTVQRFEELFERIGATLADHGEP